MTVFDPRSLAATRPELLRDFAQVYEEELRSAARTARRFGVSRMTATRMRNRLGLPPGPSGGDITGPRKRNQLAKVI